MSRLSTENDRRELVVENIEDSDEVDILYLLNYVCIQITKDLTFL